MCLDSKMLYKRHVVVHCTHQTTGLNRPAHNTGKSLLCDTLSMNSRVSCLNKTRTRTTRAIGCNRLPSAATTLIEHVFGPIASEEAPHHGGIIATHKFGKRGSARCSKVRLISHISKCHTSASMLLAFSARRNGEGGGAATSARLSPLAQSPDLSSRTSA